MRKTYLTLLFSILLILAVWFWLAPPQVWLNLVKRVDLSDPVRAGEALAAQYNCTSCHVIQGNGRLFGPSLDGITRRIPAEKLRMWLLTPRKVNPATAMPDLNLSDQEAEAIIHYLRNLDDA